jgi:hypothetical protein
VLEIDERAVGPKLARNLVARDEVAWPLQKHEENLERLSVQLDAQPLPTQLSGGGVRFKHAKAITPSRSKITAQVRHVFRSV